MTATPHDLNGADAAAYAWPADGAEAADAPVATWKPLDLAGYLNGTIKPAQARLMARTDGVHLLYPGHVHSVAGESESGKSMLMLAVVVETIAAGGRVLFIDYESDPATVVDRLVKMGANPSELADHLDYVQPQTDPVNGPYLEASAWSAVKATRYELAVLDGVTEALSVSGVASIDNDEVTGWIRRVPRALARSTGAAVVLVDHVTKSSEGRGRFAIGAQSKLSALDGAAFIVEPLAPLGVGMCGRLAVRVGKDRPGRIRGHGGAWRKSDRTQAVAVAVIDSTDPARIVYTLEPPARDLSPEQAQAEAAEDLRRRIVEWIRDRPSPPTFNDITKAVSGSRDGIRGALDGLIAAGEVATVPGPRKSTLHTLTTAP
ncbi:helicase RepA family protein [Micrococcus luteus]|nr:helicase RepA family protein [Micrococcus luteus]